MVFLHYRERENVRFAEGLDALAYIEPISVFWVDLMNAETEEKLEIERLFATELFTKQEAEEIESSSKYSEIPEEININSNFLYRSEEGFKNEAVSFILKDNVLITQRNVPLKSFDDAHRKIRTNLLPPTDSYQVFILLFEIRIDFDADFLENIAREISDISRELTRNRNLNDDMLIRINDYQELTMLVRENIIDKQRIISSILKSQVFPKSQFEKMRIMIKDVGSLLDHTLFNFERLEYLQNTFLGLVDIQQNNIIKLFTVVTVIFMPPTLIASLYGMNFKFMPELDWRFGYPFAIGIMLLSSAITLFLFRKNRWL